MLSYRQLKGLKGKAPNETDYYTESIKYARERGLDVSRESKLLGEEFPGVGGKSSTEINKIKEGEQELFLKRMKEPSEWERVVDEARVDNENLKKEIGSGGIELGSGPFTKQNFRLLKNMTIIGADKIRGGAKNITQFSKQMVSEFGAKVKPWLKDLYKGAKQMLSAPKEWFTNYKKAQDPTQDKLLKDWGQNYTENMNNYTPTQLKKIKNKVNATTHLIESKLIANGVVSKNDLKALKKELLGDESLKKIMDSPDPSSYLRIQAYQDLLMRYGNRWRAVVIGGEKVSIDKLVTGKGEVEVYENTPITALLSELGYYHGGYKPGDISTIKLTDEDLITDADLTNKQGMGKLLGSPNEPISKKSLKTLKRVFRNSLSTGEWMGLIQTRYGVKTFDAWKELRNGINRVEIHRSEWTGRLRTELKEFGIKEGQSVEDFFTQQESFQIHDALVKRTNAEGKIIVEYGDLSPKQKKFYDIAKEYYSDPKMQKAYAVMRFMDWLNGNNASVGKVPPDVIQLANGELIQGKLQKGNKQYYHMKLPDGEIIKIRKGKGVTSVGKSLVRLKEILEREQAEGSKTFDEFYKELMKTEGFLVTKDYAPEFSNKT